MSPQEFSPHTVDSLFAQIRQQCSPAVANVLRSVVQRILSTIDVEILGEQTRVVLSAEAIDEAVACLIQQQVQHERKNVVTAVQGFEPIESIIPILLRKADEQMQEVDLVADHFSVPQRSRPDLRDACVHLLRVFDQSENAPLKAAIDALIFCAESGPRDANGKQIGIKSLNESCRRDPGTLLFVDSLAPLLEQATHQLVLVLKKMPFCPRSPVGASTGNGDALTSVDKEDIHSYLSFLALALRKIEQKSLQEFTKKGHKMIGLSEQVQMNIQYSAIEAAFFSFLKRRFPGLFYSAEIDTDDAQRDPQKVISDCNKNTLGWSDLLLTLKTRKEKFELAASLPSSADESKKKWIGQFESRLRLHESVSALALLQHLQNVSKLPANTERIDILTDTLLQTQPNLFIVQSEEDNPKIDADQIFVTRWVPSLTHNIIRSLCKETHVSGEIRRTNPVEITMHYPGGPACIGRHSLNALDDLLHPEDPTAILAKFLARQAESSIVDMRAVCKDLEISQALSMGKEIEALTLVLRNRTKRGLFGLGKKYKISYIFVVMSREDAEKLQVTEAIDLPKEEKKFLKRQNIPLPADPVMLLHTYDEDSDGGGGGGKDPQPEPAPSPRKKQEMVIH